MRWLVVVGLLLVGCATDPFGLVGEVERFTPPAAYRVWYGVMERCTHRTGDFDRIQWWIADSIAGPPDLKFIGGAWRAPHTIWLRRWAGYAADDDSVRTILHEEIHDLLQTAEHPRPPFGVCDDPAQVGVIP